MQPHRHTLRPPPDNLTLPPRPDTSTFSFSQIGRASTLLQRFGPKPSNAATTTIIAPIETPGRNDIIISKSESAALGNDIPFTPLNLDLWADAAQVQEEWASVERPQNPLDAKTERHMDARASLGSSELSLAAPSHTTPLDGVHPQAKLVEITDENQVQNNFDGSSIQNGSRNPDSMDITFSAAQTANPPLPPQTNHVDPEKRYSGIEQTMPKEIPLNFHNPLSSLPVQPSPSSRSLKHLTTSSNHSVDNPTQSSSSTVPGVTETAPVFVQEQHLRYDDTPIQDAIITQDSVMTPVSQHPTGENASVAPQMADTTLGHDASLAGRDRDPSDTRVPPSTRTSQNLRHREKISDTDIVDSYRKDCINSTSQPQTSSDDKMVAPIRDTQIRKVAQEFASESRVHILSKHSTRQTAPSRASGRYAESRSFIREESYQSRSSRPLSPDRSGLTSGFGRYDNSRRGYPEPQDRRARTPPRASMGHNGRRSPRSRSPSPSSYHRRPYNARSRSPRSPYSRRIQNRTPSPPPPRKYSPQRANHFRSSVPPSYIPNPEMSRNDHYFPPRRQGYLTLPPRTAVNMSHHIASRKSNPISNYEKPSPSYISNLAETKNVSEKISGSNERQADSILAGQQTDTKILTPKRNRDDPELLQSDTHSGKRRKLESGSNNATPGESTLASRMDLSQHSYPRNTSPTTVHPGQELWQRLSDSSGHVGTEKPSKDGSVTFRRISSHAIYESHHPYPEAQRNGAQSLASRFNVSVSSGLASTDNNETLPSLVDRVKVAGSTEPSNTMSTPTQSQAEFGGLLIDRLQSAQYSDMTPDSDNREVRHGTSSLRERLK